MCQNYTFVHTDAGRSTSRRSRQRNDCTVRAYALCFNLSYDQAYEFLASKGRKSGKGFRIDPVLPNKISFPPVAGVKRMTLANFCRLYSEGRYICKIAKHVLPVIDGVVYDTDRSDPERCVYVAWRIDKTVAEVQTR